MTDAITAAVAQAGALELLLSALAGLVLGAVVEALPAEWGILRARPMTRRLLSVLVLGASTCLLSMVAGGPEPWWHGAAAGIAAGAGHWLLPIVRRWARRRAG